MKIFIMKKKELKKLAKSIAEAEYIIQTSDDKNAISKAQKTILDLTSRVAMDLEEMTIVDDLVQEMLTELNS